MKIFPIMYASMLLATISMAALAEDYEADQNSALKLLSTRDKNKSVQSNSCLEGWKLWQATSERLNKNIADHMEQSEEERQIVQKN